MKNSGIAINNTPRPRAHSAAKAVIAPRHSSYDVVIIGGAVMGTSVAGHLATNDDFQGRILVVERDPSYQFASTSLSNSSIRHQFSTAVNFQISQYGTEFIRNFRELIGDPQAPAIATRYFGYLYLADDPKFANHLRSNQTLHAGLGVATQILTSDQIAKKFLFYNLDDIILGSFCPCDEAYFDAATLFGLQHRAAKRAGVEYLKNEFQPST